LGRGDCVGVVHGSGGAGEALDVLVVDDARGHGVGGAAPDESGDRQFRVGGDRDQVPEAAAAQRAGFGEQADVTEDGAESGDLRAANLSGGPSATLAA
jgi:hypothetical protein